MRISPRALAAIAALAIPAAAPHTAGAATISFGVDLNLVTANSDPAKTCSAGTWWYIIGPIALGSGSCQFTASGIYNGAVFGSAVPATGTVTAARIKVGSITGPMRINVVRTLFQQTGSVANPVGTTPYLEQYGPTFTPEANGITTIPLDLKVRSEPTPDPSDTGSVAGTDWLAIELLSGDVPVPLTPYAYGSFFAAYPGPTASNFPVRSQTPLPNYGQNGYVVPMNFDLTTGSSTPTPGGGDGGGDTGGGGGGKTATVGLDGTAAKVASGAAKLGLLCKGADCSGKVVLKPATGKATAAAATTYGSATFSGKAGKKFTVKVKLNSKGKQLLARKRSVKIRAVVTLTGAKSSTTLSVTLKR